MSERPLTPKQQAFVREYLVDLNASAAYLRAGYRTGNPNVCGPRLWAKVGIQAALRSHMEERAQRVEVTADQVLAKLWLEAQRQGKGASHSARIRALELVGLHVGLKFTQKHELSGPDGAPIPLQGQHDLSKLSTEELASLAALLGKATQEAEG